MTELDRVKLMCECVEWDSTDDYNVFTMLSLYRRLRGEEVPTWDTFRAKVSRQ